MVSHHARLIFLNQCQGIIAGLMLYLVFIFIYESALAQTRLQALSDGNHIFASRLPDTTRHPDIQLAGAEIYVFQKMGNQVIGERFIANSSEINCFKGQIKDNIISGKGIEISFPNNQSRLNQFDISINLKGYSAIDFEASEYAKGSIERCIKQFNVYVK